MIRADPSVSHRTELKNVSGGCINQCYTVSRGSNKYFLKVNSVSAYPGMFEAEFKGLNLLRNSQSFLIPEPLLFCADKKNQFLLLEFILEGRNSTHWYDAGKALAKLHVHTAQKFGLDYPNYIGSLKQINKQNQSFIDFFIESRIEPMLRSAIDTGNADKNIIRHFENLFARLSEIIPVEKPALLHGDLWSGNIMSTASRPAIFDPAVYYGHREADIAMTKLFAPFGEDFYYAYNSEFPLAKGWEARLDIFNLYPLLVHVNLFGGGYFQEVKQIIKRF